MKSKLSCLLLIVLSFETYSQDKTDVTNVVKATIINPGVSYEARVGKFQTVYAQLFINSSTYSWTDYNNQVHFDFYFDPAATLQYRYYYNARQREEKEKRTEMNSLNYFSFVAESILSKIPLTSTGIEEEKRRAVNHLGLCWGMQRNYNSRFSLDLYFGAAWRFSSYMSHNAFFASERVNISEPVIMGQLNLGFWLNKKPK
jgi:hypothetical protein